MRKVKTNVIPVIIQKNGTISKSLTKSLGNILGKARNQGTTANSRTGHCARTWESANITT